MEEALTALLANVAGGRCHWDEAPQKLNPKDGPYVVLYKIDGAPGYHSQGPDGLTRARIQANCMALTTTAALATARALVRVLSGYRNGPIQGIFIESDGRALSAADAGEVNRLRGRAVDFIIQYSEN